MLEPENWHDDAYGQLAATAHNLKLIIRKFDGCVRYLVIRSAEGGERRVDIMLASGTESTVNAAMMAAERTARRMSKSLLLR
jgi:hypothetical protein